MKTINMIQQTSLLGAIALSVSSANAVLLAYEGFDYTADTLLSSANNGGTGWANGWESVATGANEPVPTIRAGALSAPVGGLPSTGGFLEVVGTGGDRHHRSLSAGVGADNTTIYISFLARQLGTAAPNAAIELNRNNGSAQNILTFGSDSGGVFGVSDKTGSNNDIPVIGTSGFLAPDTNVHQWLIQIDYNAGNDDVTFTYDGVLQGTQTGVGNLAFDEFGALFFSGTAGMEIDEIRIGTELADVIPEPSSALLLGFGALGFLRRRR